MQNNKDILKDALYEIKQEELKNLPSEDEIDYSFTDGFLNKVNKLIKEQKKGYSSKTLKRAIIILIAAILAMVIAGSAVADSNKILDFIYRIRSDSVLFIFEKNQNASAEAYKKCLYTLKYIPEEYEQSRFNRNKYIADEASTVWKNSQTNEDIYLDQHCEMGTIGVNTYGNYVEEININSIDIIYVEQAENVYCLWKENGYYFELHYPHSLGKEFLTHNIGYLTERPE